MGLIRRAASLATVPLGAGARMAGAATKVAFGADAQRVYDAATLASVNAAVATLAKVRGPAMKFGQVMAVFTSALPPEIAGSFAALGRLYESAEPVPFTKMSHLLDAVPAGTLTVDPTAVAAASLGQVHRGTWTDPESNEAHDVAVKLRYPEAPASVRTDMAQLRALVPLLGKLLPGLDVKAMLAEHTARLVEELDYRNEARWMDRFSQAWEGGDYVVPRVLFASESVLVSAWMDGTPMASLIASAGDAGTAQQRDRAGELLCRFTFLSPGRVGATHADPHPGNFRLLADGRLGVLDFGSVADGARVFTNLFARTAQLAAQGDTDGVRNAWVEAGMVAPTTSAQDLVEVLDVGPDAAVEQPYEVERFMFTPEWLSASAARWRDPSQAVSGVGKLRFPPSYLLEHRAVMGTLALLAQLHATVGFREICDEVTSEDKAAGGPARG